MSPSPRKPRKPKVLPTLGWREWLSLPELGIQRIRAKVDTGARTSALYATHVRVIDKNGMEYARFRLHYGLKGNREFQMAEAQLMEFRTVRSSSGESEERPVIRTRICVGGRCWRTEITLTSRRMMEFPMLLGRNSIARRFLVNPGASYCNAPETLVS